MAPWQERGISPTQKDSTPAGGACACLSDTQLASALLRQQHWRSSRAGVVKGCVIKTAGKNFNAGSVVSASAATAASRSAAASSSKAVPSIPTTSQCADADIGGLGVGGRALVGRSDVRCRLGGGGGAASRKEVKVQHCNVNANISVLDLGGKGSCGAAPMKRALTGGWGMGNRGTAAAGGFGPTVNVHVK